MIVGGIDGVFWDGRYDRENVIGGGSARRASCDSIVQTCPGSLSTMISRRTLYMIHQYAPGRVESMLCWFLTLCLSPDAAGAAKPRVTYTVGRISIAVSGASRCNGDDS
jgi:hypothetical protein